MGEVVPFPRRQKPSSHWLTDADIAELSAVVPKLPGCWQISVLTCDDEDGLGDNRFAELIPHDWGTGYSAFLVRREGNELILTDDRRSANFGGLDLGEDFAPVRSMAEIVRELLALLLAPASAIAVQR